MHATSNKTKYENTLAPYKLLIDSINKQSDNEKYGKGIVETGVGKHETFEASAQATGLTQDGAIRSLASIIQGVLGDRESDQEDGDSFSKGGELALSTLRKEVSYIFGIGCWADMELTPNRKKAINETLRAEVMTHMNSYLEYDGEMSVFERIRDARMVVYKRALKSKFGINAAPTAAMIAGAPLVLHVREVLPRAMKIAGEDFDWNSDTAIESEWEDMCAEIAIFRKIDVNGLETLRAEVNTALKDAVKTSLSPTVVLISATPGSTLLRGLEIVRALCDSYGAYLHLEGSSLSYLGPLNGSSSALKQWAHSFLLQPAYWFSIRGASVVLCCQKSNDISATETSQGKQELQVRSLLALTYLLHRVGLSYSRAVVISNVANLDELSDKLALKAHLVETARVPGFGLLVSASSLIPPELRSQATETLMSQITKSHISHLFHMLVVSRNRVSYIAYSPLLTLKYGTREREPTREDVGELSKVIVSAAAGCAVAMVSKIAFNVRVKGCVELEQVDASECGQDVALFYCGLRIVPLGCASWKSEKQERQLVEKATVALAADLAANCVEHCECVLYDEGQHTCCVLVGPKWQKEEGDYIPGDDTAFKKRAAECADVVIEALKRVLFAIANPRDVKPVPTDPVTSQQTSKAGENGHTKTPVSNAVLENIVPSDTQVDKNEPQKTSRSEENVGEWEETISTEPINDSGTEEEEVTLGFWERVFSSGSSVGLRGAKDEALVSDIRSDRDPFDSETDEEFEEDFFRP